MLTFPSSCFSFKRQGQVGMGIQTKAAIEIKHREGSKYRKFCDKEDLSVFQPPVSSPVLCPAHALQGAASEPHSAHSATAHGSALDKLGTKTAHLEQIVGILTGGAEGRGHRSSLHHFS